MSRWFFSLVGNDKVVLAVILFSHCLGIYMMHHTKGQQCKNTTSSTKPKVHSPLMAYIMQHA